MNSILSIKFEICRGRMRPFRNALVCILNSSKEDRMKSLKLIALAVAVSMVGLTVAADATAQITSQMYYYYADASLTGSVVGRQGITCTGSYVSIGTITDYYKYAEA